jgi:ATP-dependent RNA helicase DeaD
MELPSTELINDRRIAKFKQRITDTLANEDLALYSGMIEQYQQEHNVPAEEIAAALARLLQGDAPFLLQNQPRTKPGREHARDIPMHERKEKRGQRGREAGAAREEGMERFRIEVGHLHGVKPGNIVGAIANEAGIESRYIGRIDIHDDFSLIDLPEGMPKEIFNDLKKVWVSGQQLKISRIAAGGKPDRPFSRPKAGKKTKAKVRSKGSARSKNVGKRKKGAATSR